MPQGGLSLFDARRLVRVVSPWVKGFKPPSKCPGCKHIGCLVYTGRKSRRPTGGEGDHLYDCEVCGSTVVGPTSYAECDLMDILLEKDVFYTPCLNCVQRRTSPPSPICVHWKGVRR